MPNDESITMKHIHFFHHQELPVPGSAAKPVSYPVCEWRAPKGDATDADQHPLNRFVCSWLTSDMAEVARCDEALQALAQLENHSLTEWFADGDMFCVDFKTSGVQFNQSNVGPEDTDWWNLPEGRFALAEVKAVLHAWRDFLAKSAKH
jgi:hypothetical protein